MNGIHHRLLESGNHDCCKFNSLGNATVSSAQSVLMLWLHLLNNRRNITWEGTKVWRIKICRKIKTFTHTYGIVISKSGRGCFRQGQYYVPSYSNIVGVDSYQSPPILFGMLREKCSHGA